MGKNPTIVLEAATGLLRHGINGVFILKLQLLSRLVSVDTLAIKHETDRASSFAGTLTVRIHYLAKLGAGLDFEVDFCIILSIMIIRRI